MTAVRRIYQLVVLVAGFWSIAVVAISLLAEEKFLFIPMQGQPNTETIEQRGEVLRLTFFLLFAYFSFLHIFLDKLRISAGHVLVSAMTCLTFVGSVKILILGRLSTDIGYLAIFGLIAFAIFLGSRPRVRRYFKKRR
jgi:uncharacterized oligopeptide transporter (OPT) family protein